MKRFPMFFQHGGLVAGEGFIARVDISGKCLLEIHDDDAACVLGVNPGGVASDFASAPEAHREFLERVRLVVFDLAAETSSFEGFRNAVVDFVEQTNEPAAAEWAEALALVRAGKLELPGYRRQDADSSGAGVAVTLVATQRAEELPASSPPLQATLNEPTGTNDLSHVAIAA